MPAKKQINAKLILDLAGIGCTQTEIAAVCGADVRTLQRRFSAELKTGADQGRSSLRRRQWQAAMEGNVSMLIWLGKQLLGQREPIHIEHAGSIEYTSAEDLAEARARAAGAGVAYDALPGVTSH